MPWCPKCHSEYREGYNNCSRCEVLLVDSLELEETGRFQREDLGPPCFLTNVLDQYEANIIESILVPNGIPVLLKHREAGSYLNIGSGMTVFGVDIFVPQKRLEEAKELIKLDEQEKTIILLVRIFIRRERRTGPESS